MLMMGHRTKKVIEQGVYDYNFIKEELEEKIKKDYNMEELAEYLTRFKEIEITSFGDVGEEIYLDFIYKSVNAYVYYKDGVISVGKAFEIFDKDRETYVIDEWLEESNYIELLNTTKEEQLKEAILDLEFYKDNDLGELFDKKVKELIQFVREEY